MIKGIACCALAIVLLGSCSSLTFKQRDDLTVTAPRDLATVRVPFQMRWSAATRTVRPLYAVFVDTRPMPPGQDLRYFAQKDLSCLHTNGCPDAGYLAQHDVFLTRRPNFTVGGLQDLRPKGRQSAQDRHEISIVTLDRSGRRTDETATVLTVFVDRSFRQ